MRRPGSHRTRRTNALEPAQCTTRCPGYSHPKKSLDGYGNHHHRRGFLQPQSYTPAAGEQIEREDETERQFTKKHVNWRKQEASSGSASRHAPHHADQTSRADQRGNGNARNPHQASSPYQPTLRQESVQPALQEGQSSAEKTPSPEMMPVPEMP